MGYPPLPFNPVAVLGVPLAPPSPPPMPLPIPPPIPFSWALPLLNAAADSLLRDRRVLLDRPPFPPALRSL
jgi:hypothetical protein